MQNYIQTSNSIDTILDKEIKGGDLVIIEDIIGIAATDGDGESLATVSTAGVFALPKASEEIQQGKVVYWNIANKKVTLDDDSGTNPAIGFCWRTAGINEGEVQVALKN